MKTIFKEMIAWYLTGENKKTNATYEIEEILIFARKHRIEGLAIDWILANIGISSDEVQKLLDRRDELLEVAEEYEKLKKELAVHLNNTGISYVFLKGVSLDCRVYKKKYHRQFADIDILSTEKDLEKIETILKHKGFIQGDYKEGKIIPADREKIIFQRMYTHEIYSYMRVYGDMCQSVDVNFKFSWNGIENEYEYMKDIPGSAVLISNNLDVEDGCSYFDKELQFIHLCCHLYNELNFVELELNSVTTWKERFRLSWLLDIILIIENTAINWSRVLEICSAYGCDYKIEFTLTLICEIYDLDNAIKEKINCKSERIHFFYNAEKKRIKKNLNWIEGII